MFTNEQTADNTRVLSGRQTNKWTTPAANIGGLIVVGGGGGGKRPARGASGQASERPVQKPETRTETQKQPAHGQRERQTPPLRGIIRRHKVLAKRGGNHGVPKVIGTDKEREHTQRQRMLQTRVRRRVYIDTFLHRRSRNAIGRRPPDDPKWTSLRQRFGREAARILDVVGGDNRSASAVAPVQIAVLFARNDAGEIVVPRGNGRRYFSQQLMEVSKLRGLFLNIENSFFHSSFSSPLLSPLPFRGILFRV